MSHPISPDAAPSPVRKLSASERHRQLLDVAISIVREEGADRLTLGRLAARAGVSKPVAYDHFGTRSRLLVELYRWIDAERVAVFREALRSRDHTRDEIIETLAAAYIDCVADTQGEFFAIGAALAGSEEKAAVYQELLGDLVAMFAEVLQPYSVTEREELDRRCVGLIGAGEALSAAVLRGQIDRRYATRTLATLIGGALGPS